MHHRHIRFKFQNIFASKYVVFRSTAIVQTTREMTRTLQNQREDSIFDLPHPLPMGQVCFKQFPTPGPEGPDLS